MRELLARLTDTLQAVKPLKAMAREPLIAPVLESETRRLNQALEREVDEPRRPESLQDPLILLFLGVGLYVGLTLMAMPLAEVVILVFLCARIVGDLGEDPEGAAADGRARECVLVARGSDPRGPQTRSR